MELKMKNIICIIVLVIFANMVLAGYYRDDLLHPPSGECRPKTYAGFHEIYHYIGPSKVTDDYTSNSWSVEDGSTTKWELRETSSGKVDPETGKKLIIPKAKGTMKGVESKTDKTERLIEAIIKAIKSIDFNLSF